MKIKAILAAAFAVVVFASCEKKLDEKVVADITSFEESWSSLGTQVADFGGMFTAEVEGAKGMMMSMDSLVPKKGAEAAFEAGKTECAGIAAGYGEVGAAFEAAKGTWEAETAAFGEWKTKAMSMEIKAEEIPAQLEDFKTKMATWTTNLDSWKAKLASLKDGCKMACDNVMASGEMPKMKK